MRSLPTAGLFAAAALACSAPASAQTFLGGTDRHATLSAGYVGGSDYAYTVGGGGPNAASVEADFDSGYALSGAVGSRFSPNVRSEVAVAYRSQEGVSSTRNVIFISPPNPEAKLRALSLDLNIYYDLPTAGPVRPYLGAGAGLAQVSLDDALIEDEASTLNLQAMAGVSAAVSPRANIFAEARYQRLGSIELETQFGNTSGNDKIAPDNLSVFAGVRFGF
jgi:opacity protein-like surface antigen